MLIANFSTINQSSMTILKLKFGRAGPSLLADIAREERIAPLCTTGAVPISRRTDSVHEDNRARLSIRLLNARRN